MPVYSNPGVLEADFLRLVNSPIGADVRLIIGEEQVTMHAHSLILQARSAYFARALSCDWKEANQGVIYKPNVTPAVFERILQYIYGGRLIVDDETVTDLIKAADELCMDDLLFGCERHALSIINRNNVLEMVHLASQHNLRQLKTECLDFIASNIDYLKKGKPILTLDADVLKDIISMDQVDLDELEIWKIAVRWAYFQQGLDWEQCPLLDFPKGTGCVIVQTTKDDATAAAASPFHDEINNHNGQDEGLNDVHMSTNTVTQQQRLIDEDRFKPHAQSVFQTVTSHNMITMNATVHEELCKQISPLLPAIRFMRIPSVDFLRLIEGTGLLPLSLCVKIYRYHSVPSMTFPDSTSLRQRMAFSNILTKEHKEVVIDWLQANQQQASQFSSAGGSSSRWSRRSMTYSSSPPNANSSMRSPTSSSSSYYILGPSSTSPPVTSPIMTAQSPPQTATRVVSMGSPSSYRAIGVGESSIPQQQLPQNPLNQPKLILLYRATRDGFDAINFHKTCDQRGPTLTVVRADNGAIFGGYNSSSWSSHPTGVYSTSRVNFLFTLKSREHPSRENAIFNVKGDGNAATYNKADFGPTFGTGHDLYLASNCNLTCLSSSAMPLSYHGLGASPTTLAGSFNFR
ncbi:hypothetical protein BGZ49_009707, partial [Haplosporangium sp. Z 27]